MGRRPDAGALRRVGDGLVFSRTWVAIVAASVALWGFGRFSAGVFVDEAVSGGGLPTARTRPRSPAVAPHALGELAACLDDAAAFARAQPAISAPAAPAVGVVESWYRRACVSQLQSSSFDAFVAAYGERSRARVEAILAREEDLAAELLAGAGGVALDPDLVWEAALGRTAAQLRGFGNDLVGVLGGFEPALGVAGERDRCGGRSC